MKLYLVRHGETEYNQQLKFLGRTDIGLSEKGLLQAHIAAEQLSSEGIKAVYSSDMLRARQTAEAIAGPHGLDVRVERDLREIDFGRWEGLTYAEIEALDPDYVRRWVSDPINVPIPDGETWQEFEMRLTDALRRILDEQSDAGSGGLVLVSHGGAIRVLMTRFNGGDAEFFKSFWPPPGSVNFVEIL